MDNQNPKLSQEQAAAQMPKLNTPIVPPPPIPSGRNWKKWIIIGGAILIIILSGTAYVLSQQKDNNPVNKVEPVVTKASPTPDPTTSWKIYENEKYQYSLKYPPQWEIQNEKSLQPENIYFYTKSAQNPNYNAYFFITVDQNIKDFFPTKEWYTDWAKQIPGEISIDKIKFEETVFQSYPALKVNSNEIFFAKDGYVFRIALAIPNGDDSYKNGVKSVFDQMLSTFKFTDSSETNSSALQLAKEDLAKRLNAELSIIEVISSENTKWSDGSLGCPEPGRLYTMAIVEDGYKIVLSHNGKTYNYHGRGDRSPFLCEK